MKRRTVLSLAAAVVPLPGNGFAVAVWLPLLTIPAGIPIRPMAESAQACLVDLLTLAVGVAVGLTLLCDGRRLAGWLCILFSCTPHFVGTLTAGILSSVRD